MRAMIAVLMLAGCSTTQIVKIDGTAENGLSRFEDKKTDVVCYIYQNADGNALSCLRTK